MAKLDIKNGYHLLAVDIDSQKYLNFASPIGVLRYLRAPMGLRSSNDSFVSITNNIFSEAKGVTMIQAIDDFLICSTSLEDLIRQLEIINKVAAKYHVVFNADKVEVGPELVFTGMLIRCRPEGAPIIVPDPKSVQALMAIPEPANK